MELKYTFLIILGVLLTLLGVLLNVIPSSSPDWVNISLVCLGSLLSIIGSLFGIDSPVNKYLVVGGCVLILVSVFLNISFGTLNAGESSWLETLLIYLGAMLLLVGVISWATNWSYLTCAGASLGLGAVAYSLQYLVTQTNGWKWIGVVGLIFGMGGAVLTYVLKNYYPTGAELPGSSDSMSVTLKKVFDLLFNSIPTGLFLFGFFGDLIKQQAYYLYSSVGAFIGLLLNKYPIEMLIKYATGYGQEIDSKLGVMRNDRNVKMAEYKASQTPENYIKYTAAQRKLDKSLKDFTNSCPIPLPGFEYLETYFLPQQFLLSSSILSFYVAGVTDQQIKGDPNSNAAGLLFGSVFYTLLQYIHWYAYCYNGSGDYFAVTSPFIAVGLGTAIGSTTYGLTTAWKGSAEFFTLSSKKSLEAKKIAKMGTDGCVGDKCKKPSDEEDDQFVCDIYKNGQLISQSLSE